MEDLIIKIFKRGLKDLLETDKRVIDLDVSEQCICARLAFHMENHLRSYDKEHSSSMFEGYYVDVEFNRMFGEQPKYVCYDGDRHSVRADLLIHSRGLKSQDNLLWLEMKKESNKNNNESDRKRVASVTQKDVNDKESVNNTSLGIYLTIETSSFKVEYYREGKRYKEENIKV